MIILEGPDGGGKTTLMHEIMQRFPIVPHPKFVPSDGVVDREKLYNAALEDTQTLCDQPVQIYDRHPLISEYVYGPIIRGELPHQWESPSARMMRSILANHTLVVWCLPNVERVRENTVNDEHESVFENIDRIYASYRTLKSFWLGRSYTYDYESPMRGFVFNLIVAHLQRQTDLRNDLDANPLKDHSHE